MRQRITFLHDGSNIFDPGSLEVSPIDLKIQSLKAAREDRITFALEDLPQELHRVLKQCQGLHIRWVSSEPYETIAPYLSRVSPGLHIFFSPGKVSQAVQLCPLIKRLFGEQLKCSSVSETFSSIPDLAESPLPSKVFQYYQNLHSIHHFLNYVRQNICVSTDDWCQARFATILQAKYLDLDYDTLSSVLTLSAYWDRSPGSAVWTETIPAPSAKNKVEVGILSNERPADPRELSIGGFLTVVGDDQKPSQTLFSFASRHHPLPARAISTFEVSFPFPTGLHPTFRITFPSTLESSSLKDSCSLNAYLTLPSYLFIDKYQLSDPVFLSSKNLEKMRSLYGEADLEAPDWIINRWGSNLLIEIAQRPHSVQQSGEWHADIPLHLRYLKPTSGNNGRVELNVPWPIIFWACPPDDEIDISVNPFDRANLGYDLLFPPNTIFHHLSPIPPNGTLLERLTVPSLDLEQTYYIEPGTVLVILAGFLWICLKLFKATQLDALASIKTSRNKLRAE